MKLSIITVNFNDKSNLKKTIDSVKRQTLKIKTDYEFIVIDGKSTDGSLELIKSENIITKYISEKDEGIYDAMNKGIKIAKGDFINFLNAGDYYLNDKILEKIFLKKIYKYDLIYGPVIVLRNNIKKISFPKKFTKFNLYFWTTRTVCHQAMFVKKNIVGKYSHKYRFKGELNWYFDLIEKVKKYKIIDFPIIFYDPNGIGIIEWKFNMLEKLKVVFSKNILLGFLSLPLTFTSLIRFLYKKLIRLISFTNEKH